MSRFLLYLVVFIAILLSLCISAAGCGLKQALAGNGKKVFIVCECVCSLRGDLSAFLRRNLALYSLFPCLLTATLEQNLDAILIYVVNHE